MLTEFGTKMLSAGLRFARIILYVVSAPFGVIMTVFGTYFIVAGLAWIVLIDAAFICAVLIFEANFLMFFVALFNSNVWTTMGNMWVWLWSWFADGNIWLWPHLVKSFPPYLGAGIVFMLLINLADYLKRQTTALKATYASA